MRPRIHLLEARVPHLNCQIQGRLGQERIQTTTSYYNLSSCGLWVENIPCCKTRPRCETRPSHQTICLIAVDYSLAWTYIIFVSSVLSKLTFTGKVCFWRSQSHSTPGKLGGVLSMEWPDAVNSVQEGKIDDLSSALAAGMAKEKAEDGVTLLHWAASIIEKPSRFSCSRRVQI